jgi:hypothetical protein
MMLPVPDRSTMKHTHTWHAMMNTKMKKMENSMNACLHQGMMSKGKAHDEPTNKPATTYHHESVERAK